MFISAQAVDLEESRLFIVWLIFYFDKKKIHFKSCFLPLLLVVSTARLPSSRVPLGRQGIAATLHFRNNSRWVRNLLVGPLGTIFQNSYNVIAHNYRPSIYHSLCFTPNSNFSLAQSVQIKTSILDQTLISSETTQRFWMSLKLSYAI